ncbi:GNAT family N-acetyltransferase [Pedobacter panaciterrae]|jgi:Acetyltransferases, including N-acetylases of ribosomal proteins|uniref:GNAT family N-acetyltransferase n=1 Tax=Pedobacter panaciterrae TaxID=363849 RepID=A0ABU8NR92_9SPHI|nr:GNAT family N-acetyltransferase [Pedobacter panaciterrae]NQX54852.1 GNAT family N-acetyltransferase [Pedobacter panaciterrae]
MKNLDFSIFPVIKTSRLLLRELAAQDALQIHMLRSDPKIAAMTGRTPSTGIEDAMAHIYKIGKLIENNASIYWAISLLDNPSLIGTICLWNFDAENAIAEIGYELLPDFQGKGFMREAITAVIKYGFEELKVKTITAFPSANNISSVKVLKMAGFKRDNKVYPNSHGDSVDNVVTFSLTLPE